MELDGSANVERPMKTRSLILAAALTAIVILAAGTVWFLMGMRP